MRARCKRIEIVLTFQPNRILVHKPPAHGVVIETVGFAVFVGEDGQTAGFVVGVGEGMAQCIGNGFEIAVFGVTETGGFAGTVGKADELVEGVVVNC